MQEFQATSAALPDPRTASRIAARLSEGSDVYSGLATDQSSSAALVAAWATLQKRRQR